MQGKHCKAHVLALQDVTESQQQQPDPSIDMQLRQNMLRSHPVPHSEIASRAVSPYSYDSPPTVCAQLHFLHSISC